MIVGKSFNFEHTVWLLYEKLKIWILKSVYIKFVEYNLGLFKIIFLLIINWTNMFYTFEHFDQNVYLHYINSL